MTDKQSFLLLVLVAAARAEPHVTTRFTFLRKRPQEGQLVQVQRIGVKSSLVLLRWDDEELLVLQGDGPAQLIARKRVDAGDGSRRGAT